jgi:hypothetical protein
MERYHKGQLMELQLSGNGRLQLRRLGKQLVCPRFCGHTKRSLLRDRPVAALPLHKNPAV